MYFYAYLFLFLPSLASVADCGMPVKVVSCHIFCCQICCQARQPCRAFSLIIGFFLELFHGAGKLTDILDLVVLAQACVNLLRDRDIDIAEGFVCGEALSGRGRVAVCGSVTAQFIGFLISLGFGVVKLIIIEDDERLTSWFTGVLIDPGILVVATGDIDGGNFPCLLLYPDYLPASYFRDG